MIRTKVQFTCKCGFDKEAELPFLIEVMASFGSVDIYFTCEGQCPECEKDIDASAFMGKVYPSVVYPSQDDHFDFELELQKEKR